MPLADVRMVQVPSFDELSVKHLWPEMQTDKKFMVYFPDVLPKNRLPSRDYFFNVLSTLYPEYIQKLIKHASE